MLVNDIGVCPRVVSKLKQHPERRLEMITHSRTICRPCIGQGVTIWARIAKGIIGAMVFFLVHVNARRWSSTPALEEGKVSWAIDPKSPSVEPILTPMRF